MSAERLREAAKVLRERAWGANGTQNAQYIAMMRPGVSLALADWLELVSAWIDEGLGLVPPDTNVGDAWADVEGQAHKVADLILGAES